MKITHSFWKNGSGGFGFGVWKMQYPKNIIWTIAFGPMSVYIVYDNISTSINVFRPIGYGSGNGFGQSHNYMDKEDFGYGNGAGYKDGDEYESYYGDGYMYTVQCNNRRRS